VNISQDTFNKILTMLLMVFFMTMYVASWLTGKVVDWQLLLTFLIPIVNNAVHQLTATQVTTKNIEAETATTVAKITANGKVS